MTNPFWDEYARVQHLVETGKARDEQLDALLSQYPTEEASFTPVDSRRKQKNLDRNLRRKDRRRLVLLQKNKESFGPRDCETSHDSFIRKESSKMVREAAGDDWPLLRDTCDGDYATMSGATGMPVGTIKSQVFRARNRLRSTLCGHC